MWVIPSSMLSSAPSGGSGTDWLERHKPYLNDGKTVVSSPHKVFGPDSNDLALQLRGAGVSQVILADVSANLCVESHMGELLEQGFEVVVVTDATAAAILPEFDGYEAASVNFRLMASDVGSTAQTVPVLSTLNLVLGPALPRDREPASVALQRIENTFSPPPIPPRRKTGPSGQAAFSSQGERHAIKGTLEYQACDDKQCFNPVAGFLVV